MTYRFIGIDHLVGPQRLNEYGQTVDLADEQAREAVLGGCPLIPQAEFAAIFTPEEQAQYRHPGPRQFAPEEMQSKFHAARLALHKYRESLKGDQ